MNDYSPLCSVIIVSNNSEPFLEKALHSLQKQTIKPDEVIVVDSGSKNKNYLYNLKFNLKIKVVIGAKGIGFCRANNIGMDHIDPASRYVFFLNPDAFPFEDFVEKALEYMEDPKNHQCGAITGKTYGYDINNDLPTERYDTTGIFHSWYGKWYDRGQGDTVNPDLYNEIEEIPAICGAVFFSRRTAIEEIMINGREVFKESFYMYKDDIDLSLRLKRQKWKLIYNPALRAYHCRGWSSDRKKVSRLFRLTSAKNELKIHLQQKFIPGILYSSVKFLAVKLLNV